MCPPPGFQRIQGRVVEGLLPSWLRSDRSLCAQINLCCSQNVGPLTSTKLFVFQFASAEGIDPPFFPDEGRPRPSLGHHGSAKYTHDQTRRHKSEYHLFVLQVIGMFITYFVILVQFRPGLTSSDAPSIQETICNCTGS